MHAPDLSEGLDVWRRFGQEPAVDQCNHSRQRGLDCLGPQMRYCPEGEAGQCAGTVPGRVAGDQDVFPAGVAEHDMPPERCQVIEEQLAGAAANWVDDDVDRVAGLSQPVLEIVGKHDIRALHRRPRRVTADHPDHSPARNHCRQPGCDPAKPAAAPVTTGRSVSVPRTVVIAWWAIATRAYPPAR
jgi:hypothetical protein